MENYRLDIGKYLLVTVLIVYSIKINCQNYYNVIDFKAKNDGTTLCSEAIKEAIETASKNGGGTIFFPAGEYLTGPIHLKSNITLFLDAGAVIKFSDNFQDYLPMVPSRWEGVDVTNFSPLIYAFEAENITITGRGKIDGQGKKWWNTFYQLRKAKDDTTTIWQKEFAEKNKEIILPDDPEMMKLGFLRPPFIQTMFCKNVRIEGITITNSPFWTVNPEFCDNVIVTGVTILNPKSPNTDGINPESCSNVHISDCHISVGDDCITIKSGKDAPGRKMARPAENYTITNCTMLSGHGGVVIGSEMSGNVRKIVITNCIFDGTERGIRIKSTRGRGGVVEDIRVSNIIMKNIKREAITLNLMYNKTQPEPVSERSPQFKNIHISNVTGTAKLAGTIIGLEELPVENISFNDINIDAESGFDISNAKNITFSNIQINTKKGASVIVKDSEIIEIEGCKNLSPIENTPVIELNNVKEIFIHGCYQPVDTDLFLNVKGENCENIYLKDNRLHLTKTIFKKGDDVPQNVIIVD